MFDTNYIDFENFQIGIQNMNSYFECLFSSDHSYFLGSLSFNILVGSTYFITFIKTFFQVF
ncbi:hypothetical protein COM08_23120 [Bacillus wiedmannii]|nr:hypothetical protein COL51_26775 [Bacillus wiedmannii]PGC15386.1 hypothetical protein COM08_23120 [Bacillus wiedmannii]PGC51926.1 hypothetical protein COM22_26650 [Bacillus wiedmannii]PHE73719.1 hypothetical protein COF77_18585 [Bacillus wiedmannii]